MTPLFPAQHAAEEFDSVLEGRATTAVAERYAGLVATVQVLREQPEVTPRAEFVAELRSRLMMAAEAEMVPAAPVVRRLPTKSRRNRRLGSVAAALVIVGGSAGMAAAASGALPGDALYPIKRGVEQVVIAAHFGDASKGTALLGQADERLGEVKQLLASDSASPALVDATVADFRESADAGSSKLFEAYNNDADTADITAVRDFTATGMSQLASMAQGADPSTAGPLRDAADTLADIDQQAAVLCASCGGEILTPPPVLASGAGAPAVKNLIARPIAQARADIADARAARAAAVQAKLGDLRSAAQGTADNLGKTAGGGTTAADSSPLVGAITSTGKLVPGVTTSAGSAVKNLVGGLTGTVGTVTGGGGGGGSSGVSDAASDAGDTVGKTVDGLTGTVDGLTGNLLPGDK